MLPVCAMLLVWLAQAPAARDLYARALELEAAGNRAAALPLLWEAAGLAPRDAEVQNRLGEALEGIGALDAAADAFRRALAARPSFPKASNNLVLTLAKAGKGPEAVALARTLVAAAPSDPSVHFTLGLAQAELDVDAAIATFRRVLDLDPRHTLARYNLALVLKRADRFPEAIDELGRVIAIDGRKEAHYTLGVIFWQQGDPERAEAALGAAIAADDRYAEAYYTLGAVRRSRRDWNGAAGALRRAIALRPDLRGAHDTLALVLESSGDVRGAARHREEAEQLRDRAEREQEAGVWTSVGTQKLDRGDAAGAAEMFTRATKVFESYAPAYYQLGRALRALGEHDRAQRAFSRARELNPSLVPPG